MYTLKQENFISISSMLKNHLFKYPSPASLTYWWNLGFILMIFLSLQLISGIFLAMHYCSDTTLAFISVEHIMRDVNFGWLFRYAHANGASFFFICVYIHIFRGLFFKSFLFVNFKVWISGVILFLLMMGTAFIGYVLPWGQMSFWGATVITNMASAVPWVGSFVVSWIWGGFSVGAPTLSRFFSFHYVLPFVVLAFALIHMAFLHEKGSSNPALISPKINRLYIPLYPYFIIKDLFGASTCLVIFFYFISFFPDFLGHSDNYIEADSLSTPPHIVPEWYFLPFYAILRSIDNKISGVLAMLSAIAMYLKLPYYSNLLYRSELTWFVNSFFFRGWFNPICAIWFTHVVLILGWLGAKPVEAPYVELGEYIVKIYFFFFPIFFLLLPAFLSWVLQSNELKDDTELSKILLKWHKIFKFAVGPRYLHPSKRHVLFYNLLFYSSVIDYINNPEIFNANLFTLSIFIFASIFFILLLLFLSLLFSNSFFLNNNTNFDKPFECGFSPFLINPSVKMSVHAFRIALIFLLFDLEILYLLPWVYSLKHFLLIKSTFFLIGIFPFFFILFIGILYEYSTSLTDWRAFSL